MEKGVKDFGSIKRCAHKAAVIYPSWIVFSTRRPMHIAEIRRCHRKLDRLQFQRTGHESLQSCRKIQTGNLFDRITDEKISEVAVSPTSTWFKFQSVGLNFLQ